MHVNNLDKSIYKPLKCLLKFLFFYIIKQYYKLIIVNLYIVLYYSSKIFETSICPWNDLLSRCS